MLGCSNFKVTSLVRRTGSYVTRLPLLHLLKRSCIDVIVSASRFGFEPDSSLRALDGPQAAADFVESYGYQPPVVGTTGTGSGVKLDFRRSILQCVGP